MIKILQSGQFGSTKYLVDMHRVRTKIFRDRMGWDVDVDAMEMEIDEYDRPETIYVLSVNDNDQVVGTWRFLTTDQPSMIRDIWPHYLQTLPIPTSAAMCETSRFGVYYEVSEGGDRQKIVSAATAEMIVGLIDVCIKCGIEEMFTLYNVKIKRLLERIGFVPAQVSAVMDLEGEPTVTARFEMNEALLTAVRRKTGVTLEVGVNELPPALIEKFLEQQGRHGADNVARAS